MKFAKLTASILAIVTLFAVTTTTVSAAPGRRHLNRNVTYTACTFADCDSTGVHKHNDCFYTGDTGNCHGNGQKGGHGNHHRK